MKPWTEPTLNSTWKQTKRFFVRLFRTHASVVVGVVVCDQPRHNKNSIIFNFFWLYHYFLDFVLRFIRKPTTTTKMSCNILNVNKFHIQFHRISFQSNKIQYAWVNEIKWTKKKNEEEKKTKWRTKFVYTRIRTYINVKKLKTKMDTLPTESYLLRLLNIPI